MAIKQVEFEFPIPRSVKGIQKDAEDRSKGFALICGDVWIDLTEQQAEKIGRLFVFSDDGS